MHTANDYRPHLEHLTLQEIVERDVDGHANEQERAYLRSEQTLSDWRTALGSLNSRMDNELAAHKKRLAERERLHQRNPENPETESAYLRESKEYEDAKQRVKQRKEIVQQRIEENNALRQRRHERLMQSGTHRDLLLKARSLLATDEAIAYNYLPRRDELLEEIDRGLYGHSEEAADE